MMKSWRPWRCWNWFFVCVTFQGRAIVAQSRVIHVLGMSIVPQRSTWTYCHIWNASSIVKYTCDSEFLQQYHNICCMYITCIHVRATLEQPRALTLVVKLMLLDIQVPWSARSYTCTHLYPARYWTVASLYRPMAVVPCWWSVIEIPFNPHSSLRRWPDVVNASGINRFDTNRSKNKMRTCSHYQNFEKISESTQTMVLDVGQQDGPKPKCYFTHAPLPSYIDNAHPPTKKEPFRTVLDQQYSHNVRRM